jgi:homoserine O-acetyltransferase
MHFNRFQFNHGCVLWSGYQTPVEGDYVIEDFQFESGESLPKLNLHYRTIGKPTTDGKVNNAILIKHGTTGSGEGF